MVKVVIILIVSLLCQTLVRAARPAYSFFDFKATNFFNYGGETDPPEQSQTNKILESLKSEERFTKTGTTIVGICCRDGVVLGADTRSTGGPIVMDKNVLKIHRVSENIRCCAAGTSADCNQITRKAGHFLSLLRIEQELSGDWQPQEYLDSVSSAVTFISNHVRHSHSEAARQPGKRKLSSVQILGGVDASGPLLYQIDSEGVPQRVAFGALGSGSTDALSVLESQRRLFRGHQPSKNADAKGKQGRIHVSITNMGTAGESDGTDSYVHNAVQEAVREGYCEDISVEEAVQIVRTAVKAGIQNDMGSGSHVDLCVISYGSGYLAGSGKGGTSDHSDRVTVKQWREEGLSTWDADRIRSMSSSDVDSSSNSDVGSSVAETVRVSDSCCDSVEDEGGGGGGSGELEGHSAALSTARSADPTEEENMLGKRIFSRTRLMKQLVHNGVQETNTMAPIDTLVGFDVRLIE